MKITWGLLIAAALADAKLPAYKVLPLDDSVQESGPSLYFKDGSIVHNAKLPGLIEPLRGARSTAAGPDSSCEPFKFPVMDASDSCRLYSRRAKDVVNAVNNTTFLKYFKRADKKMRDHIAGMYGRLEKECAKPAGEVKLSCQHPLCDRGALYALDGNKTTGETTAIYCPNFWPFYDEQYRDKHLCEGKGKRDAMTHGAMLLSHVSWTKPVGAQFKFEGDYIAEDLGALGDFAYNEAHYCLDVPSRRSV